MFNQQLHAEEECSQGFAVPDPRILKLRMEGEQRELIRWKNYHWIAFQ